jgi:hypothetical protein
MCKKTIILASMSIFYEGPNFFASGRIFLLMVKRFWTWQHCTAGEVDFWIFLDFQFPTFAIDGKNNSKTKVKKVFFFIFMSSYAEMSF